jgi:hypothetical protein
MGSDRPTVARPADERLAGSRGGNRERLRQIVVQDCNSSRSAFRKRLVRAYSPGRLTVCNLNAVDACAPGSILTSARFVHGLRNASRNDSPYHSRAEQGRAPDRGRHPNKDRTVEYVRPVSRSILSYRPWVASGRSRVSSHQEQLCQVPLQYCKRSRSSARIRKLTE